MEIGEKLFQEVAEQKAAVGDAIVSYDMTGSIYAISTTSQFEERVNLDLEEKAMFAVTQHLLPENCN